MTDKVNCMITWPDSDCCDEPIVVVGNETIDYVCSKCGEPCGVKESK